MDKHQKHTKLTKPALGQYSRNELAILGTNCGSIRKLINAVTQELHQRYKISYVDAEHNSVEINDDSLLNHGGVLEFTDKISYRNLIYKGDLNSHQNAVLFNNHDLVLVNGNHFKAESQVVIIDAAKPLDKKLDKLTNIQLIVLTEGVASIPDYIVKHLPTGFAAPVLQLNDILAIATFLDNWLKSKLSPLNGLVLAGGKSERMQTDKGSIYYYGKSQRLHTYDLLKSYCPISFVSYADPAKINADEKLPVIIDAFTNLGPFGGILSVFRHDPNAAWLTVACDLPYLSAQTLSYLVNHRNPSKVATCFMDSDNQFPEPLITIWEPRAYPIMLQFLSQGYSCPRKVLINSDVELLQVPNATELQNINTPQERDVVMQELHKSLSKK